MKEKVQKIRFKGLDFILTDPDDVYSSPIATIETYKNMECSYAQYYKEGKGRIMRFRDKIGETADIEFGEIIEIEIDMADAIAGLMGDTWPV